MSGGAPGGPGPGPAGVRAAGWRRWEPLLAVAVASLLGPVVMAAGLLRIERSAAGFDAADAASHRWQLWLLVAGWTAAWAGLSVGAGWLRFTRGRGGGPPRPEAAGEAGGTSAGASGGEAGGKARDGSGARSALVRAGVVLGVAAAARLAVLLVATPELSDDLWRYVHDGRVLASGGNPYAVAPAERDRLPDADPALLDRINHPELVTIYLPTSQAVFAAAAWTRDALGLSEVDPLGERTLRGWLIGLDLLAIVLLMALLRRAGRSVAWAAMYAWHPLAIVEVAGSGHQDVIGIAAMLGGMLLLDRRGWGAAVGSGAAAAAAVMVKPAAALMLLPCAIAWPGMLAAMGAAEPGPGRGGRAMGWRGWAARRGVSLGVAGAVGGTTAAAFAAMPGGVSRLLETGRAYAEHWAFNASLHAAAQWLADGRKPVADAAMAGLLAAVVAGVLARVSWAAWRAGGVTGGAARGGVGAGGAWRRWLGPMDPWRGAGWLAVAPLLLGAVVHPWYLLWALPVVCLRWQWATWVWSLTIAWSYFVLVDPIAWALSPTVQAASYVPVWLATAWAIASGGRRPGSGSGSGSPGVSPGAGG